MVAIGVLIALASVATAQDEQTGGHHPLPPAYKDNSTVPLILAAPNPAVDHTVIEVPAPAETAVTFRVVSADGEQLLRRQVLADDTGTARTTLERDRDGLPPGQYQVAVATTNGRGSTSVTFSE